MGGFFESVIIKVNNHCMKSVINNHRNQLLIKKCISSSSELLSNNLMFGGQL